MKQILLSGYTATAANGILQLGTAGSYGVEQLEIRRMGEWENLAITMAYHFGGEPVQVVVPPSGVVDVPAEALANPVQNGKIVFRGVAADKLVYSADIRYTCTAHSSVEGDSPVPPTPSEIEQVLVLAKDAHDSAVAAADSANAAETAAGNAAESAKAAANAAENAAGNAANANNAAVSAQASAEQAVLAANRAEARAEAAEQSSSAAGEQASAAARAAESAKASADNAQAAALTAAANTTTAAAEAAQAKTEAATAAARSDAARADAETAKNAAVNAENHADDAKADAEKATEVAQSVRKDADAGKFKGEKGNPGVYYGSGEVPADCNVQVDPTGDEVAAAYAIEYDSSKSVGDAIDEVKADIVALDGRVTQNTTAITDTQKTLTNTNRSLDALWKLNEGQTYSIEQIEESGMNNAPSGAMFQAVKEAYGKTEQDRTNGANIAKPETGERVINGITAVPNADGTWTANGTATRDAILRLAAFFPTSEGTFKYYCCGCPAGGSLDTFFLYLNNQTYPDVGNGVTVNSSSMNEKALNLLVKGGVTVKDLVFKPMISYAPCSYGTYEPYTGGIPSPNPDYPQEIKSVESIHILHTDAEGATLEERTITPPRPLNAIGEYRDKCDVVNGVWEYEFDSLDLSEQAWSWQTAWGKWYTGYKSWFKTVEPYNNVLPNWLCNKAIVKKFTGFTAPSVDGLSWAVSSEGARIIVGNRSDTKKPDGTLVYQMANQATEPINPADLEWLRALAYTPASDHIIITDQDGNDVPWLNEYIINLREVASNG